MFIKIIALYLHKYIEQMSKNNERNAGRRAVIDGKYITVKVTRKHIPKLKEFAKSLQEFEPKTKKR